VKTYVGLKKKICFINGENIEVDGTLHPIEVLKEEDYNTGYACTL